MECSWARAASSFRNSGKRAAASTAFLTCTGRPGWARPFFPLCPRKGWSTAGQASERFLPFPALLLCWTLPKARKRGGEGEEKETQYIMHRQYLYSVQTQFTRAAFRAVVCSTQTVQGDTPVIQHFKVLRGLILLHFLLAIFPRVMYYSVPALMRAICGQKRSQGKE